MKTAKTILLIWLILMFCLSFQSCGVGVNEWPVASISTWYDITWLYRQQITISSTMAPSDQTDFPVLIKESELVK